MANVVIVLLMGIGLAIVYIEISRNVVSDDIRNAFTGIFLAVTLFLLAERISELISVIVEHNRNEQDRQESDIMYMNIQGLSRQILQSIGNTRGITRLGHISTGLARSMHEQTTHLKC
jgi:hypothetical protein